MKKLFSYLLVGVYCLSSCNNPSPAAECSMNPVNTDSLVTLWDKAWNSNDSAAIVRLMAKDVILISDGSVAKGIDSLAKQFVGPNSKVLKNLKTNLITSGGCGNEAYYFGTYTHDVALKDTTLTGIAGVFSFIFAMEDNQWKIKVAEIEENKKK